MKAPAWHADMMMIGQRMPASSNLTYLSLSEEYKLNRLSTIQAAVASTRRV
jgi:hypothetical protein